ncbi:hypothetical protein HYPSUDRAFT_166744 [Hypholoma sublateritium FD-334 SS-4]|uniref:Uncharacterized protein n=1 Tax=Hypholoma sublateritium (strain FD-334 SS-4) TaxID=945553 RepID=A0A0D2MB53_HYPSF|nr:hypothetical protein HYPSUDRAFT_166744 [Hypholoma sublateritium FD-334 SS-4]
MVLRAAFKGSRRKLVLAFDVGTTYSGISYSVLDPGQVPEIKGVTRFPAHEQIGGASKIPTVIYYDQDGKVRAVGAEAMQEGIYEQADEEQWVKAEWFKLHLRSQFAPGAGKEVSSNIHPLPPNKSVIDVFADYLAYLFECASSYIQGTHPSGVDLWASVQGQIDFVFSHPNGWEGAQQSQMRKAAVLGGLIPDTAAGHARLSFVTEGEASLHFAIYNGLPAGAMEKGDGVVIVDAGGGTVDVSSYSRNTTVASKEFFDEIAAPQCHFHGSVFVSINAHRFLENYLTESPFLDDIDHIVRCFDKTTKLRFRNADEPQYIKFGSTRDNDHNFNIRVGQLKLNGSDVAVFFEPSVNCVIMAVLEQRRTAHKPVSHVVLVGGFAASDYMFNKVYAALNPTGLNVMRPESHVIKAVSDGAISFYLDRFVRTRVSKLTYGTFCRTLYNPSLPEHRERSAKSFITPSGERRIDGAFDIILPKNTQISEAKEFKMSYWQESASKADFKNSSTSVWCYRGLIPEPRWMDVDTKNYTKLCTIDIDLSHAPVRECKKGDRGGTVFVLCYEIVLIFGLTELRAQVAWKDLKDVERRSESKIIYDPDTTSDSIQA